MNIRKIVFLSLIISCLCITSVSCSEREVSVQQPQNELSDANYSWQWGSSEWETMVRKEVEGKTLKIGFTSPAASEFYDIVMHGAYTMMNEIHDRFGVDFEFEYFAPGDHSSVNSQIEAINNWVINDFDAVLVCTGGEFGAMNEIYESAARHGTSVYLFNMPAELWNEDEIAAESVITYNMSDQAGRMVGEYAADVLGGEGKILFISGSDGHWTQARIEGFLNSISKYPGLEVVSEARGEYVRDAGMEAAEKLLQTNPDADLIYAENEEMGQGAVQAIKSMNLKLWDGEEGIIVIALDGLLSGYEQIRMGDSLTATVDVGHVDMGREAIKSVFLKELLGYELDKVQIVPCLMVDRTNVDIPEAYAKWAMETEPAFN